MDKYALVKRFYHKHQLQVYMYYFMYIYLKTIPEETYFPDTKKIVNTYKKISTTGPIPTHWFGFSFITFRTS